MLDVPFNPNPLGILAGNLPESSRILTNPPVHFWKHAPCIFIDLSSSALGSNFAPFEEVKVPVSDSADLFSKKAPLGGFWRMWGG